MNIFADWIEIIDEIYKVQKDFDEWCNIELEIWK